MRFIYKLKGKLCKTKTEYDDCLTSEEINSAEKLWIKHVQKTLFHEKTFTQTKVNLGVFVDDEGILRCSGRIQYSSLPYDSKFPMLLPNGHYFTKLIIANSHEQVWHNKVRETLTQLRSRFWVIKGRKAVKEIVSKCFFMQKNEGKYYSTPAAPPLPSYRVADFGFTSVGIDHAGPVFVKNIYESDGTMYKAYITVVTCTVTRAIHLELNPDLNADSLVRALKRFKS